MTGKKTRVNIDEGDPMVVIKYPVTLYLHNTFVAQWYRLQHYFQCSGFDPRWHLFSTLFFFFFSFFLFFVDSDVFV